MEVVRTRNKLRTVLQDLRTSGNRLALVPTMGALHAGHISLVHLGLEQADKLVASLFVNPTQFGANEDFSRYPRTEEEDLQQLEAAGTTVAYLPAVEEMYQPGAKTTVQVKGISESLCGAVRPGHFDGVALIVTKLLMQTQPDIAVFGEKDYQQLQVIRQLVRDLDIPVEIMPAPIMREPSGLAMSSRNRYLSPAQQTTAAALYRVLQETWDSIQHGHPIKAALRQAAASLLEAGFESVDYMELRDAQTLEEVQDSTKNTRLLAAARIGSTRLIDNMAAG